MSLHYRIKSDAYDGLDEAIQSLYEEDGDDYVLAVEGVTDKSKLENFRRTNRQTQKELKELKEKYAGIDLDEVKDLLKKKQELDEGKMIKEGDVEGVIEQRIKKALAPIQAKLEEANGENEKLNGTLNNLLVTQQITRIGAKVGVRNTAIDDLSYRASQVWKVKDGKAVALDGDGDPILNSKGSNITMEEWTENLKTKEAPHLFSSSKGGNEGGSDKGGAPAGEKTSHQKIVDGLKKL